MTVKTIRKNANKKRADIFSRAVNVRFTCIQNDIYNESMKRSQLEKSYQEFSFSTLVYDDIKDSYTILFYSGYSIRFDVLPRSSID